MDKVKEAKRASRIRARLRDKKAVSDDDRAWLDAYNARTATSRPRMDDAPPDEEREEEPRERTADGPPPLRDTPTGEGTGPRQDAKPEPDNANDNDEEKPDTDDEGFPAISFEGAAEMYIAWYYSEANQHAMKDMGFPVIPPPLMKSFFYPSLKRAEERAAKWAQEHTGEMDQETFDLMVSLAPGGEVIAARVLGWFTARPKAPEPRQERQEPRQEAQPQAEPAAPAAPSSPAPEQPEPPQRPRPAAALARIPPARRPREYAVA